MDDLFELGNEDFDLLTELPVCGCGSPEDIYDLYRSLLSACRTTDDGWPRRLGVIQSENVLAYWVAMGVLDDLRATEHGGSLSSAWITDKGERLLDLLNRFAEDYDRTPCIMVGT